MCKWFFWFVVIIPLYTLFLSVYSAHWMQSVKLNGVLPVVFVHCVKTYRLLSGTRLPLLKLASCFCSLRSPLGHQYSILKEGKMQYIYIYIYTHTHTCTPHMCVDRHDGVSRALDASSRSLLCRMVASRIFISFLSSQSCRLAICSLVQWKGGGRCLARFLVT